jgi:hypothetical protein
MSKPLQTAVEKVAEPAPAEPTTPNLMDLPPALAGVVRDLREHQLKGQHRLFIAVDTACREHYATGPSNPTLPGYIALKVPPQLMGELRELHRQWLGTIADCEAHNHESACREFFRQRDQYRHSPDPTRSVPEPAEIQKSYRLYRDSVVWKYGREFGQRLDQVRIELAGWLISALETLVGERLRSESQDADRHNVPLIPNMATWALSALLNRYHMGRLGIQKTQQVSDPDGASGRGVNFSPGDEILKAVEEPELPSPAVAKHHHKK